MNPNQPPVVTPPNPSNGLPPQPLPIVVSQSGQPPAKKTSFAIKVFVIFFITGLFLTSALGVSAFAIAYEKINLNNPKLQNNITQVVFSLPLVPKTAKYILQSSLLAHAKVLKHGFEISLSAKPEGGVSVLGFNQFDVLAKGKVDYSKSNDIKLDLNGSITNDFNLDLRKDGPIVYFRINRVPWVISEMFKLKKDKLEELLKNWVEYDTTPLQSEAQKELDKSSNSPPITSEYVTNLLTDLMHEKLLPSLVLSEDSLDENPVYKIHLVADSKTIDELIHIIQERSSGNTTKNLKIDQNGYKGSDYLKDLNVDLFIDKKTHFISKVITTFKYNPNYSQDITPTQVLGISNQKDILGVEAPLFSAGKQIYAVAAVVKLDEFGQSFQIEKPAQSLKIEEFYRKVFESSETFSSLGGDPIELTRRSRDAARLTDLAMLQNAINVSVQEATQAAVLCTGYTTISCSGRSIPSSAITRNASGKGWVKVDLQSNKVINVPTLPFDPVNDQTYHYTYCAFDGNWEIDTVLESTQYSNKMATDGGDDASKYETGSNLNLIGKVPECSY